MLLGVGVLGVSVGWIADRARWDSERSGLESEKNELSAAQDKYVQHVVDVVTANVTVLTNLDSLGRMLEADDPSDYARTIAVNDLIFIHRSQNDARRFGWVSDRSDYPSIAPRHLAREIMYFLDVNSSTEFFEAVNSLDEFKGTSHPLEIKDPKSEQFKLFRKFISDTFEQDQQPRSNE